jgi:UDPglucose 6-dehydrogenase
MKYKKIAVLGIGYVGLSFAAVLANCGYKVYAIDIDKERVDLLKKGKAFFSEKGLDDLISHGIKNGNLIPTTSYEDYLSLADIVCSCVGTPDLEDGSSNLSYVFDVAQIVANLGKQGVVFVQKSTVPVGTGREVMKVISEENPNLKFSYVSNPEFLSEGSAVYDTFSSDRVVLGSDDKDAIEKVLDLYRSIQDKKNSFDLKKVSSFAHIYRAKEKGEVEKFKEVKTSLESAELIKVTSNALLSLKISFANSIALLCDKVGADINEVMDGVGLDKRIGRSFLYAGRGYGGGCFPKDVSGLIKVAEKHGVDMEIMDASVKVNEKMTAEIVKKVKKKLGNLEGKKIAFLGLAFKPGTSDVRKSPAIKLAKQFIAEGCFLCTYDPEAMEEAEKELGESVVFVNSTKEAIEDSDFVCIATEWPEFFEFDYASLIDEVEDKLIVDCQNRLDKEEIKKKGFEYIGVGRS